MSPDLSPLGDPKFIKKLVSFAKQRLRAFPSLVGWEPLDFVHDAICIVTERAENRTLNWDPSVAPLFSYMAGIINKRMLKLSAKPEYQDRAKVDPGDLESIAGSGKSPEGIFGDGQLIEACRRCPCLPGCKLREIIDAMREADVSKKGWIAVVAKVVGLTDDQMHRRMGKLRKVILFLKKPLAGYPGNHGVCRFGPYCMADPHARRPSPSGGCP